MARALIVGCGCRGRMLGERLREQGWAVRGTSRREDGLEAIGDAGLEGALADPDRPASLLELIGDVTVVHWLLGSAEAEPEVLAALHGPRLEHFLERIVDTPVRGLVYEAAGRVPEPLLAQGGAVVRAAAERWRIPVAVVRADPTDADSWAQEMLVATLETVGAGKGYTSKLG